MKVGVPRTSTIQRLKAYRALSLTLGFLALSGWAAFAYSTGSSASAQHQLREEVAQLKASQDQLLAERKQQQDTFGEITERIRAKLASAHEELRTLAEKREQAKAQVAEVQQELTSITKRLEDRRTKVSEASKVRVTEPSSKSTPGQTQTKSKT
jgi:chromosome segregation ATPase